MSNAPTKAELENEIESDAVEYFDGGRFNNISDIVLTISAVLTSLIAATVAATDVLKWVRVGVAAVPAACTSIQKILETKARANWYFTYAARLRALGATLRYTADPDLEDFAKKKGAIELEMEKAWAQIGRGNAKLRAAGRG